MLYGLQHFHTRTPAIIHRDIKSDNLLIGFNGAIKIGTVLCLSPPPLSCLAAIDTSSLPRTADFGFCCRKGGGDDSSRVGTTNWMAPEVIKGKVYDCNADVWGVGACAFFELAFFDSKDISLLIPTIPKA